MRTKWIRLRKPLGASTEALHKPELAATESYYVTAWFCERRKYGQTTPYFPMDS
jgi:hypothetical protein